MINWIKSYILFFLFVIFIITLSGGFTGYNTQGYLLFIKDGTEYYSRYDSTRPILKTEYFRFPWESVEQKSYVFTTYSTGNYYLDDNGRLTVNFDGNANYNVDGSLIFNETSMELNNVIVKMGEFEKE